MGQGNQLAVAITVEFLSYIQKSDAPQATPPSPRKQHVETISIEVLHKNVKAARARQVATSAQKQSKITRNVPCMWFAFLPH